MNQFAKKNNQRAIKVREVFEAMISGKQVSLTVDGKLNTRQLKDAKYKIGAMHNNGDVDLVNPLTLQIVAENVRPEYIELNT